MFKPGLCPLWLAYIDRWHLNARFDKTVNNEFLKKCVVWYKQWKFSQRATAILTYVTADRRHLLPNNVCFKAIWTIIVRLSSGLWGLRFAVRPLVTSSQSDLTSSIDDFDTVIIAKLWEIGKRHVCVTIRACNPFPARNLLMKFSWVSLAGARGQRGKNTSYVLFLSDSGRLKYVNN